MNDQDLYWLADLLEGEGSFLRPTPSQPNCPAISLEMTDEDVVSRACSLMDTKYHKCKPAKEHYKYSYRTFIRGKRAVHLMKKLYPILGARRKSQIDRALLLYNPIRKVLSQETRKEIVEVYRGGMKAVDVAKRFSIRRETVHRLNRTVE